MSKIITHPDRDFIPYTNFLSKTNLLYEIHKTQYTTLIKVLDTGEKHLFTTSPMDKKTFMAYNMIKSDINKRSFVVDSCPRNMINYFDVSNYLRKNKIKNQVLSDVYCIDIKSAYPTTLKNFGAIEPYTYSWLHKKSIPKSVRLKACGMLATQKVIYFFRGNKQIQKPYLKKDQNLRNIFFAVSFEVGEVMNLAVSILGKRFLFYWVDGIYFTGIDCNGKIKQVTDMLSDFGYESTVEKIDWMKIADSDEKVLIDVEKGEDIKPFILPKTDSRGEKRNFFYNLNTCNC